jgi:hypothetical protein
MLGWAVPANALDILFDPDGAGPLAARLIDVFDPNVGNSIAINGNALSQPGADVTALFQSNLTTATRAGANVDLGGNLFTVVAGFHETVLANSGGLFPTLVLGIDTSKPSFFDIYAVPAAGDNLTGLGFIVGAPILSGVFINSGAAGDGITAFTVTGGGGGTPLDAFGPNNYPATSTLAGVGSGAVTAVATGKNALYFPTLVLGTTLELVSSELKLNYTQGDPSACFSNNGTVNCNQLGVATVGAVNVNGPNTMFQTDVNISFAQAAAIPEPATLTLLGIGGLVLGIRRRRSQAAK